MCSYIYESIEHASDYPIKIFTTSIEHSSYHWHYDYELILVLKGELLINTSPEQILLKSGNIFLLNSKTVHELQNTGTENICLFIQLNQNIFNNGKHKGETYYFYLNSTAKKQEPQIGYPYFERLAAKIGIANYEQPVNMYRIKSYVYMLLADFLDYLIYDIHQSSAEVNSMNDLDLLMQIINYIYDNYRNEDILEQVYRKFGMSEKTMYRFLKKYIGLSPTALIMETRIHVSKEMLHNSDKLVPFIAAECGFGSENTFYRVFKKEVGITPKEYRKSNVTGKSDSKIKGYLAFSQGEAIRLLKTIAKGE